MNELFISSHGEKKVFRASTGVYPFGHPLAQTVSALLTRAGRGPFHLYIPAPPSPMLFGPLHPIQPTLASSAFSTPTPQLRSPFLPSRASSPTYLDTPPLLAPPTMLLPQS